MMYSTFKILKDKTFQSNKFKSAYKVKQQKYK